MAVNYPKKAFIISGILTLLIFFAGLILGWSMNNYREEDIFRNIRINELDTQSYFLERDMIQGSNDVCQVLNSRIGNIQYMLTKISAQLPSSEESSFWQTEANLDYLKRKYFIAEVQFLVLLRDLKEKCGSSYVPILFFYTKDESTSNNQGFVLNWVNERYKDNVVILSFDKDYVDEPLINTLKVRYGVESPTTLIINEDIKREGFLSKGEIDGILSGIINN